MARRTSSFLTDVLEKTGGSFGYIAKVKGFILAFFQPSNQISDDTGAIKLG